MNDQVPAIKCLEIDNVKIYDAKGEKVSLLTKGKLEVLYLAEYDRFVLRLHNFKYTLSTHLPVMASLFEEEAFRSYVVPNMNGHYIVKLKSVPTPATVRNFETVLSHFCQFSYQQSHEHDLENQAHRKGENQMAYEAINGVTAPQHTPEILHTDNVTKASKYIKIGGEVLKQNFLKAANYIGNLRHHKEAPPVVGPNQFTVRTIEELRSLENTENQAVVLPKYEVTALITLCREIEKAILHHTDQEKGVKIQAPESHKWPMFKKTAIESAHTLWKGMDDALTSLSKAVKNKTKKGGAPPLDQKHMTTNKDDTSKTQSQIPQPMQQGDVYHQHTNTAKQPTVGLAQNQAQTNNIQYPNISGNSRPQVFEQKNASRFPNIRGEIRGQATVAYPTLERPEPYTDTAQSWRYTNDYSYTQGG